MKTQKKSVKSKVAICKSIASDRDGAKKKSRKIKVAIASIAASTALLLGGGFALSTAIKAKQDYNNSQVQVVQKAYDVNELKNNIKNFVQEDLKNKKENIVEARELQEVSKFEESLISPLIDMLDDKVSTFDDIKDFLIKYGFDFSTIDRERGAIGLKANIIVPAHFQELLFGLGLGAAVGAITSAILAICAVSGPASILIGVVVGIAAGLIIDYVFSHYDLGFVDKNFPVSATAYFPLLNLVLDLGNITVGW